MGFRDLRFRDLGVSGFEQAVTADNPGEMHGCRGLGFRGLEVYGWLRGSGLRGLRVKGLGFGISAASEGHELVSPRLIQSLNPKPWLHILNGLFQSNGFPVSLNKATFAVYNVTITLVCRHT